MEGQVVSELLGVQLRSSHVCREYPEQSRCGLVGCCGSRVQHSVVRIVPADERVHGAVSVQCR